MFLFFDTETTGLSRRSDRIVQIAWIVTDERGFVVEKHNHIIRPDGFQIPFYATRVHGISTEQATRDGEGLEAVLQQFCRSVRGAKLIVGHNLTFDVGIAQEECARFGLSSPFAICTNVCTMKLSARWCGIPKFNGSKGFKWPTLQELHFRLFDCFFDGAHDALSDVIATKECFFELMRKQIIVLPRSEDSFLIETDLTPRNDSSLPSADAPLISTQESHRLAQESTEISEWKYAERLYFFEDDEFIRRSKQLSHVLAFNPQCARIFFNCIELLKSYGTLDKPVEKIANDLFDVEHGQFNGLLDSSMRDPSDLVKNTIVDTVCQLFEEFSESAATSRPRFFGCLRAVVSLRKIMFEVSPAIAYVGGADPSLVTQVIIEGVLYWLPRMMEDSNICDPDKQHLNDEYLRSFTEVLSSVLDALDESLRPAERVSA